MSNSVLYTKSPPTEPTLYSPYPSSEGWGSLSRSPNLSKPLLTRQCELVDLKKWRLGLSWPLLLVAPFVTGASSLLGLYIFYTNLDGTPSDGVKRIGYWNSEYQSLALRSGTGMAYFGQALLKVSVEMACIQRVWHTLSGSWFKIKTVDDMFAIVHQLASFKNMEMLRRAKLVYVLAFICWILPLSTTVGPQTLSVVSTPQFGSQMMSVPTVLIERPRINRPGEIDPFYEYRYSFTGNLFERPFMDESRTLKPSYQRLVDSVASSAQIPDMPAVYPNASYSLDFSGPSVDCSFADGVANSSIQSVVDEIYRRVSNMSFPSNQSIRSLRDILFVSFPYEGTNIDIENTVSGCLLSPPIDCTLNGGSPDFAIALADERYVCRTRNTTFSAGFSSLGSSSMQVVTISNYTFGDFDFNFTEPYNNWTNSPFQAPSRALSVLMMGLILANDDEPNTYNVYTSGVRESSLMPIIELKGRQAFQEPGEFGKKVAELSRNITTAFITRSEYQLPGGTEVSVTMVNSVVNLFSFDRRTFWTVYGIAIALCSSSLFVGLVSLYQNKVLHHSSFSELLFMLRSPTLQSITAGESDGRLQRPRNRTLEQTELRVGRLKHQILKSTNGSLKRRVGFGLRGDVSALKDQDDAAY